MKLKRKILILMSMVALMIGFTGHKVVGTTYYPCHIPWYDDTTGCYPKGGINCVAVDCGGGIFVCVGNYKTFECEQDEKQCVPNGIQTCHECDLPCIGTYTYYGCDYDYTEKFCRVDWLDSHTDDCSGTWQYAEMGQEMCV